LTALFRIFEGYDFLIYLDNAATSGKKPESVIKAVNYALNNFSANAGRGGYKLAVDASNAIYRVREKVSSFFGASSPLKVAFCPNCTHAINYVIKGVMSNGGHIAVSDLEHNAVMRPVYKTNCDYTVVETSFTDDKITTQNFENAIREDTRLVICTAVSNVTGKIMPIREIGEVCKRKGVLFLVDGAQGGGVVPINVGKYNIDFLCIASHKGLLSPMGTGILIAESDIPDTVIEGGNGINSLELKQDSEMPEGFESGTLCLPNIMGIGAGIDFISKIGIEEIYEKEMNITSFFYENLAELKDVILYTPYPEKLSFAPVLSFNIKEKHSEEIAEYLDKNGIAVRGGFHCSYSAHNKLNTTDVGTVRISPSFLNSMNEAKYTVNVVKKYNLFLKS